MHWLLSLDTALFHFFNGALANPFFDWLMPILSGQGVPWLLAVVVAVPLVVLYGSRRLKLCALAMVLVVALGDPLIVGTIKDAVSRPRPFVVVPDARQFGVVGKGFVARLADGSLPPGVNVHSFPSAHAANCFALAMVAFLFYRRRAWFMVPFATAVAFSRVYNGVHYPGDVLIGGILGAGYAVAFMVLAQALWNFIGKRFFPNWHAQLPNLLKPEAATPAAAAHPPATDWLRLGYLVILLTLVGRWIYLGGGLIGLSGDEAYQWLWSKHLDLSYYSKPAGIALIQWTGTAFFGDTNFGVRFFSPLFAAILSVLVFRFLAREASPRAAFCLLLITLATPLLVIGSILMTIDPPLVLCWMWAVIAGWRAVQPDGKTRDWLVAGLALGLGFLCKYTALLQLVCWAVFFAFQPAARAHLKKAGVWLGLLVFLACTAPVIIWNAQHHWITVIHVASDGNLINVTGQSQEPFSLAGQAQKSLGYFLEFTGGESGALNPVFFLGALWAMVVAWRRRAEKPLWFFLACLSAPVFLGHWLFSLYSRVQINWIAAAVPPMFCLMVLVWRESKFRFRPWLAGGLVLGIGASVFMYSPDLIGKLAGHRLPPEADPSHRARGWRETAQLVEAERLKFDPHAFIIADHYATTGLYTFYSAPARAAAVTARPLVYCLDSDRPIDQFYFWDDYRYRQHRQGENALFVLHLDPYKLKSGWVWKWLQHQPVKYREIPAPPPANRITGEFESVTNLGVYEIKLRDGRVFQRVELLGCYHLK